MALTTLSVRWAPLEFWTLRANQEPAFSLSVRWAPREFWRNPSVFAVENRVYDSVATKLVSWTTLYPDTTGKSYPGPGVALVTTSDYCISKIFRS